MYPRYPGYLPFPTALHRAPGPVPNRNAIDNGQGNFLPEYLPAGSASFMPYQPNPTRYQFTDADKADVLYAGIEQVDPSQNTGLVPAGALIQSLPDSQIAPIMQFSIFVLNTAANLQKLPPAQASQAVNGLISEAQILSENMSELKSENDLAVAENRIAIINEIVYVATSVSPEVLNAAIAAKSIADFLLMRDSAQALRERLSIQPVALSNPRITEQDLANSALRVDAAEALVTAAKKKGIRSKLNRKDIEKLEKSLLNEDLRHIRLKLAFLQQAREDVANVADKALEIVKSPTLDVEIVGLAKALPESTILSSQTARLLPDIVAGAKQEMLRRMATTKDLSKNHAALRNIALKNGSSGCGCGDLGDLGVADRALTNITSDKTTYSTLKTIQLASLVGAFIYAVRRFYK